jgi:hypothetical protein
MAARTRARLGSPPASSPRLAATPAPPSPSGWTSPELRSSTAPRPTRLLPATDPEGFERRVSALSAVRELPFLTDRFDYQLGVACHDADDLDRTVRSIRRDAGGASTETRIVMRSSTFKEETN